MSFLFLMIKWHNCPCFPHVLFLVSLWQACLRTCVSWGAALVSQTRVDIDTGSWQDKDHEEQWFSHIQRRSSINLSSEKIWTALPPWWCSLDYYFLRGMVASPRWGLCMGWNLRDLLREDSSHSSLHLLFNSFRRVSEFSQCDSLDREGVGSHPLCTVFWGASCLLMGSE